MSQQPKGLIHIKTDIHIGLINMKDTNKHYTTDRIYTMRKSAEKVFECIQSINECVDSIEADVVIIKRDLALAK